MNSPLPATVVIVLLLACLGVRGREGEAKTPAPGTAPGGGALSLAAVMSSFDKDHDGRISKQEAEEAAVTRFAQWDADGDGFATREEIRAFRLRLGIDDEGRRVATVQPRRNGAAGPVAPQGVRAAAMLLKEPADWRLERMALPPGFAPEVKLHGKEEIRFAPGMFNPGAADYFTCVIGLTLDGVPEIGGVELQDFLERYYRGLSTTVARRSGTTPEIAEMKAVVTPVADDAHRFTARMVFFDSFSDGRKITLNIETEVLPRPTTGQTCVILLVSPSAREDKLWTGLREIGKKAAGK